MVNYSFADARVSTRKSYVEGLNNFLEIFFSTHYLGFQELLHVSVPQISFWDWCQAATLDYHSHRVFRTDVNLVEFLQG